YDAAILLALAIQKAGTATDGSAIRDALVQVAGSSIDAGVPETDAAATTASGPDRIVEALGAISKGEPVDYNGASGNCNFNALGNVKTDYVVWKVAPQDGGYGFSTVAEIPASSL
ncbi:MAG: hypothetical protein ACRELB_23335, partial [Polyangiaceae bacterium]